MMTKHQFRFSVIFLTLVSLSLRWLVPPSPAYNSTHDDQLLVTMAHNILNGNWLGNYNEMGHLVLSKPAGYSMFLAWTHWLPWAPTVTIHMILLAGFLVVLRELRFLGVSRTLLLGSYFLMAFAPIFYSETMSRLYRDGLLTALTVLFVGLLLSLRRCLIDAVHQNVLKSKSLLRVVLAGAAIGLCTGYFVITKPSWHFLVAIFLTVIGGTIIFEQRHVSKRTLLKMYGITFVSIMIFFNVFPAYVKVQNQKHFGIFALDSFSKGNYPEAMKAIYKVKDYQNRPYIDSTRQTRSQIYRISPTMVQLETYLELPYGQGWRYQPCHTELGVCDESGAWFPWEIRDAIEKAGLGDTAKEFEETTGRIAKEIRDGCKAGRIACESEGLAPGLDSIDSLSPRVVVDAFAKGFQFMLDPMTGTFERGESRDITDEVTQLWDSTIKGLPPRIFATKYESNDLFLGDVRRTIGLVYDAIWIPLILVAAVGLLTQRRNRLSSLTYPFNLLAVGLILGITVLTLQIAMLQASSGYYMNSGGNLYLLPLHPLLLVFMVVGIHCLVQSLSNFLRGERKFPE